jgi:Ca2+-binding RTX toxin-like protein
VVPSQQFEEDKDMSNDGANGLKHFRAGATSGNDNMTAGGDPDGTIYNAGKGNDTIRAGKTDDILTGGAGSDSMWGGEGADQFRFFANDVAEGTKDRDRIFDFDFSEGDTLVFGSFDAGTYTDDAGINGFSSGTAATVSTMEGLVSMVENTGWTASKGHFNNNLILSYDFGGGRVQEIVLTNMWADFFAASTPAVMV